MCISLKLFRWLHLRCLNSQLVSHFKWTNLCSANRASRWNGPDRMKSNSGIVTSVTAVKDGGDTHTHTPWMMTPMSILCMFLTSLINPSPSSVSARRCYQLITAVRSALMNPELFHFVEKWLDTWYFKKKQIKSVKYLPICMSSASNSSFFMLLPLLFPAYCFFSFLLLMLNQGGRDKNSVSLRV